MLLLTEKQTSALFHFLASTKQFIMLTNNLCLIHRGSIHINISCIERAQKSLRATAQAHKAEEIFEYLLERSGILRSPEKDKIDFIHKSFQEYLAAYEIAQEDNGGLLASKADDPDWHETLVLFMGFATKKQAESVIKKVLAKNDDAHSIMAAACAQNATSLPEDIRFAISDKLEKIIPPKTVHESERLAIAGELVLPFLRLKEEYDNDEIYRCIRVLRLINSAQGLATVASYLKPEAEERVISIIGKMLLESTEGEIRESGIEEAICNYLEKISEDGSLKTCAAFLLVLSPEHSQRMKPKLEKIKELYMFDYYGEMSSALFACFKHMSSLSVVGEFEELPLPPKVNKNIQSLTICDMGRTFNLETLNTSTIGTSKTIWEA